MPEKKNGSQEGRPASLEGASWDTNHMIWNARSLQRVVNTLERNPSASPQSDLLLFNGKGLAQAILLSLATEIALKALLCLERKKDPPRIHDLLKLFEQLEPDTQKVLRAEMPGWPWSVSTAAYSPAPNTWPIATRTPNRRGASFRASWTSNLPWKSPFPSFAARTAPGPAGSPTRASTGSWAFSTSATGDFPIRGAYLRRLLSLDYVIEHPELEWLPTEEEKVWYCEDIGIPKDRLPKRIYTGAAGAVTRYFPLKLPVAGGPSARLSMSIPATTPPLKCSIGAGRTSIFGPVCGNAISRFMWLQSASTPTPTNARAPYWKAGRWRKKESRSGAPRRRPSKKERDAISSALDTFDSKVLARFGGFTKAGQRYRELRDILARPAPHDIRIDTFEIWRSGRIYPEGVQIYETPS